MTSQNHDDDSVEPALTSQVSIDEFGSRIMARIAIYLVVPTLFSNGLNMDVLPGPSLLRL